MYRWGHRELVRGGRAGWIAQGSALGEVYSHPGALCGRMERMVGSTESKRGYSKQSDGCQENGNFFWEMFVGCERCEGGISWLVLVLQRRFPPRRLVATHEPEQSWRPVIRPKHHWCACQASAYRLLVVVILAASGPLVFGPPLRESQNTTYISALGRHLCAPVCGERARESCVQRVAPVS